MSIRRRQYDSLLTDDKRRRERNVRLLAKLENIEKKAAFLQAKTDRIKSLKSIYKNQFQNPKKTLPEKKHTSPMKRDIYPYGGGGRFNPYFQDPDGFEYQNLHYVVKNITLDEAIDEISKRYVLIPKNSGKYNSHPHNTSNSEDENLKDNKIKANLKSVFIKPNENQFDKSNSNYETYNESENTNSEEENICEETNNLSKEEINQETAKNDFVKPIEDLSPKYLEKKIIENNDNEMDQTVKQFDQSVNKSTGIKKEENVNPIINSQQLTIISQQDEILSEDRIKDMTNEKMESLQDTQTYNEIQKENIKETQNYPEKESEYNVNITLNHEENAKYEEHADESVHKDSPDINKNNEIVEQSDDLIPEQSGDIDQYNNVNYDANNTQNNYVSDSNYVQYTNVDSNNIQQYQEQVEQQEKPQEYQEYEQNEGHVDGNEQINYAENTNAQYVDENGQISHAENADVQYTNENSSYPQYDQYENQNYDQTQYYDNSASNDPQYQEYAEQTTVDNPPAQNDNEDDAIQGMQENQGYVDPSYYNSEYEQNYEQSVLSNENIENYNSEMPAELYNAEYDQNQYEQNAVENINEDSPTNIENYNNEMPVEPYNAEYDQNQYEQNAVTNINEDNPTNIENEPQGNVYGEEYDQSQYEQTTDPNADENYNLGDNSQYGTENYDQTAYSQDYVENEGAKPLEIFDTDTEQISNKEESYVQESDFEFSTNQ